MGTLKRVTFSAAQQPRRSIQQFCIAGPSCDYWCWPHRLRDAQAHRRLGSQLTLLDLGQLLPKDVRVLRADFSDNGRAQTAGETEGFLKVMTSKRGRVLGATMVGPHAGELIQNWALAIGRGLKIGAFTGMIAPYLTFGEISKQVADRFCTPTLFSQRTRALVRFLELFG